MMQDCSYDCAKVVHELGAVQGFIKRHGLSDAKKAKHSACAKAYGELERDLDRHLKKLARLACET